MALTSNANHRSADEQTQLDQIINELLGDQMFSTSPPQQVKNYNPNYGSLSSQAGNTQTIVSWQTDKEGPTKKTTVSKQTRTSGPQSRAETITVQKRESSKDGYGGSYNTQRSQNSQFYKSEKHERVGSPISSLGSPTPSRLHSVPYKIEYENRYADSYSPMEYFSDSELPRSWLQQQQLKLRAKREGKDYGFRTEQEKQLVHELRGAQMKFKSKRAMSEAEEDAILAQYSNQDVFAQHNGPVEFNIRTSSPEKTPPLIKSMTPEPPPRRLSSPPPRRISPPRARTPPMRSRSVGSPPPLSRSPPRRSLDTRGRDHHKQESFVFRTTSPRPIRREIRHDVFMSPEPLRRSHSMEHNHNHKTEKTYFVSGLERPAFTTHQTKYVFSISPPKQSSFSETYTVKSKPPPSPGMGQSAPTSPIIPLRGTSSKEAVMRSRTITPDWQPTHGHPLTRQLSDTSFDRYGFYSSSPPLSPTIVPAPSSAGYSLPIEDDSSPKSVVEESVVRQTASSNASGDCLQNILKIRLKQFLHLLQITSIKFVI